MNTRNRWLIGLAVMSAAAVQADPPTITKTFNPTTIPVITVAPTPSILAFTISNPNSNTTMTNIGFTDVLPAGLLSEATTQSVCGGTLTITIAPLPISTASIATISLTGASIANPGPPCVFPVAVVGTTAGHKVNTTSAVTSDQGTGGTATATIEVVGPPVLTKAFNPPSILVNQTSNATFTVTNPNTSQSLSGIGFTDTLQPNLFVATPNGISGTCGGGTIAAVAGSSLISLQGATLAGGASCTFSVKVTSAIPSVYPNVTSTITSNEEGAGAPALALLTVVGPPTISKSFAKSLIPLNSVTTMTITIINPNPTTALTGVGFTDTLPVGLISPATSIPVCGGTLTVTLQQPVTATSISTVTLANATMPPGSACPLALAVIGTVAGQVVNTTSVVTSNEAGSGTTATATAIVVAPPVISKSFGTALSIPVGGTAPLSFSITNPNTLVALTGVGFTDNLPFGLTVASPNGLTGSCGGGTITAVPGSSVVSLTGATLAATTTCTFSVTVLGVAETNAVNSVSVTSVEGGDGNTATAAITVGGFWISYTANLTAGDSVINITNTGVNGASLQGPGFGPAAGNICVNVYAFSPDEQMVSCCSCPITPNGLATLSVVNDIVSNTLTGVRPSSVVIKLVGTGAGSDFAGSNCAGSPAVAGVPVFPLAPGLRAWGTSLHKAPAAGSFDLTETPYTQATLSTSELNSITNRCRQIIGNGSTFGICRSCRPGALGASAQ